MLKVFVVLCFLIIFVNAQLCTNGKKDNKCACRRLTDPDLFIPVTLADCSNIKLTEFPNSSELNYEVTNLDLSLNNIGSLKFNGRPNSTIIRKINLSRNNVMNIDGGFLDVVPSVVLLDLSHNNLSAIEPNLLKRLHGLTKLDLSYNNLTKLPWGFLSYAKGSLEFDLSYNPLAMFLNFSGTMKELGITTNITKLNLNNVGFTTLINSFFDGYVHLKHIELADNEFDLVPSLPQSVEYLDLSGNKFKFLSNAYLNYRSIKVLKLNRMPSLVNIHHYAFFGLTSLKTLYITDCPNLKEFNDLIFGSTLHNFDVNPASFYLARNGLTRINESYEYFFDIMKNVDLSDNPWQCDCNILWLRKYNGNVILDQQKSLRCSTPDEFFDRSIMSLSDHELSHCFPEKGGAYRLAHVVLLILAVIVLMFFVIYLMRIYATPRHSSNVGPNSPYNIRTNEF